MHKRFVAFIAIVFLTMLCLPVRADKARGIETTTDAAVHAIHLQRHCQDTTCRVTGNYIKVRTEAKSNARVVGHLEQADEFVLLEVSGDFARICVLHAHKSSPDSRDGMEGWVTAAYVDCSCTEAEYRGEGVLNGGYFPLGMPSGWYFCSGAGAWSTELTIMDDGSFTGYYHDWDAGSDEYPNGEMLECEFIGQLSEPERISACEYCVKVDALQQAGEPGDAFVRDGMLVTITRPYGIGLGDTFIIYLPGTPLNRIPPAYHEWAYMKYDEWITQGFALYNMSGAYGWNKN